MQTATVIDIPITPSPETIKKIEQFKKNYLECFGIFTLSLKESGVSEQDLNEWMTDIEFQSLHQKAMDARHDFVESKLLDLIESGDANATIFYCSTILKHRGYMR